MAPDLRLIYTSTYKFSGLEGSLALNVVVKDANGETQFSNNYKQADQTERKFGVTFQKDSKYDQRFLIFGFLGRFFLQASKSERGEA